MGRFGFAIDNRVCIGCHACTVACKSEHSVPIGVNRTWVKYIEKGTFPNTRRSFSVQRCNHCEDAPCVEICPVTSLYLRPDGIVDFDSDRCIGCKACMQACPYDALYLDPETLTVAKCNYCTHRVDQGYEPACVVVCPVEAIVSGDLDDPTSRIAILDRTQRVQYPKVEKATKPKLFYVGGETAALDPTQAVPQADYLWSGADKGVTPAALEAAEKEAHDEARARRVYDVNPKPTAWGPSVSAYITTKAIATGTVLVSFLLFLTGDSTSLLPPAPAMVSLLFLGVTGWLLVADLTQPSRFLYVLLRPQWRSWLVRGSYLIVAYSLALLVCVFVPLFDAARGALLALGTITSVLAALVAMYTAFLFAQAKGRDYWQNPLLPVTMLVDAIVAGLVVATLIGLTGWAGGIDADRARVLLGAGLVTLVVLAIAEIVPVHQTKGAAMTAAIILRGQYARLYWTGAILLGLVIPILLIFLNVGHVLAAVLLLIGIAVKNHILVAAPQRVPLS